MTYPAVSAPDVGIGVAQVVRETVRVSGEIDMSNAAQLKAAMEKAARRSPDGFVVDLTETVYLDSAALGVFWQFARGAAVPTYRVTPGSICERTLELAGLQGAVAAA